MAVIKRYEGESIETFFEEMKDRLSYEYDEDEIIADIEKLKTVPIKSISRFRERVHALEDLAREEEEYPDDDSLSDELWRTCVEKAAKELGIDPSVGFYLYDHGGELSDGIVIDFTDDKGSAP